MTGKAEIFKFTTNVPVNCNIRFVDVRPGKPFNDPQKGPITLPAQVSIKGTFDGVETIAYLKGPVWKNIKALAAGGVINEQDTDALEAVTTATSIQVLHGTTTATLAKGPKDKYENMVFGGASVAPKRMSYAEANTATGASAPSVGGPIKGLDYEEGFPPEPEGEDEGAYADPRPLPAFHKPPMTAKPAEIAPVATEKAKIVRAYLDLFAWMRTQPEMKDVPLDVVQSASATIWIEWNKRGLVK